MRLTRDAQALLSEIPNKEKILNELNYLSKPFITKEDILSVLERISNEKISKILPEQKPVSHNLDATTITHKVEFLENFEITSSSRGTVDDFLIYFRDRYSKLKKIFLNRNYTELVKTNSLQNYEGKEVSLIGMVYDTRLSQKNNILIEVEDEHGKCTAIVKKEKIANLSIVLKEDVILITGKVYKGMIMVNSIDFPDVSIYKEKPIVEEDISIAYLSDLHFGSNKCLINKLYSFAEHLKKNESYRSVAYLMVAGDVVDGIGIYPKQENELVIKDIDKQYEAFSEFTKAIPDWIKIIVSPGNHDAVRRGEPQPSLPKDYFDSNVVLLPNPAYVKLHGLLHLIYHGTSMDSLIASIPGLTYDKPELCMKEYLRRRHLSPVYGNNLIVPEHNDYLSITHIPDVFHTGHVHKNGHLRYRNCLMINSGTFQDKTEYQELLGHNPSPGIVPIYSPKQDRLLLLNLVRGP